MNRLLLLACFLIGIQHLNAQDGLPDLSFGINGKVATEKKYEASAFQSNGKFIGSSIITGGVEITRYDLNGNIDLSFGNSGKVQLLVPGMREVDQFSLRRILVAIDNSDRIIIQFETPSDKVDGFCSCNGFLKIVLARLLPDGPLDVQFGNGGTVVDEFPSFIGTGIQIPTKIINALETQQDGKILSLYNLPGFRTTGIGLMRYNENGSIDEDYTPFQSLFTNPALSLAIGNNGEVYVGSTTGIDFVGSATGLIIYSFDKDGLQTTGISYGGGGGAPPPPRETAGRTAVQKDGKLLVVSSQVRLLRFNVNGTLDESFGIDGILPLGDFYNPNIVKPQDDGKILLAGNGIRRINADGSIDLSFGTGGTIETPFFVNTITVTDTHIYAYGEGVLAAYNLNTTCTSPTFLNTQPIVGDANCGLDDGQISIIPTSGTAPFMYSLDGGTTYETSPYATGFTKFYLPAGTYQLRLKDANGCESAVIERTIKTVGCAPCTPPTILNTSPIVGHAYCGLNEGQIVLIPTSGTAPFMYSIDGGANYVAGPDAGTTFFNLNPGMYQLKIKDANGCESITITREVEARACVTQNRPAAKDNNQLSITPDVNQTNLKISAYPNPSKGRFIVQVLQANTAKAELSIFDGKGTLVQKSNINIGKGNTVPVNLSGKAPGMYYLKVVTQHGTSTSKILIQ